LKKGAVIVYESTVWPGLTEEVCVPILEKESGLKWKQDFFVGYSPERVNPGDKEHTIEKIVKVVAGDTPETAQFLAELYGAVIPAGVYVAPDIKTAEAAKVIENIQRDINIALMNELSLIFHRLGIDTKEVLKAAGTKWNFLKFEPGLVGGHCIGVDPYYLAYKAREAGYIPQLILAGRGINEFIPKFVAEETVKLLVKAGKEIKGSKVLVLGFTFKENVPDVRNTKVYDLVKELKEFGIIAYIYDPIANKKEVLKEYGIELLEDFE
jgi:UDP-N-acetyl-D-galactosamine dehydrogenase